MSMRGVWIESVVTCAVLGIGSVLILPQLGIVKHELLIITGMISSVGYYIVQKLMSKP